mmetsp:Transcript_8686/g.13103  ORF Transcript_8686/g.13103 Transcript_8686/m.13103 type:complete len:285 (+) Transcript_8686:94-948(+)
MQSNSSPNGKNTLFEGTVSPVNEEGGGSRDFLKQSILANSTAVHQRTSSTSREVDENVDYSNTIDDDDDDDDEIEQIPMSMEEIYKMSNKNRRKAKKGPVHFFSDEAEIIDEVMDIEKAEELISRSGPLGGNYFENAISDHHYNPKSQDETFINHDKDDVKLMIELGWLKDQSEADEMVSEQRHSIEAGESVDVKEKHRTIDGDANDRKPRRRGGKGNKTANSSVDFSKVGATGGGAKGIDSNQFYEGIVGIGGGALNSATSAKERKKQSNTRKGGKRIGAYRK